MRWSTGEAVIERLLARGHIERVQGAQADGESWLERARQNPGAARVIASAAPDSGIVLAYDAARQACVALVARRSRIANPLTAPAASATPPKLQRRPDVPTHGQSPASPAPGLIIAGPCDDGGNGAAQHSRTDRAGR